MINQPNPSNGFQHHRVYETLIDASIGRFDITVGSWPTEDTSGRPSVTRILQVKYDGWMPELCDYVDTTVNEHPEWSGVGPQKPNQFSYFNMPTLQWVDSRSLQTVKDAQWAKVKKIRDGLVNGGFDWDGSTFDSDPISQQRITGAVSLAMMTTTFSIVWTLFDNTTRLLSATDMMQVGGALGMHVAAQFSKGVSLREMIDAATTQQEAEAVTWQIIQP
jgi:hypothetical protein